MLSSSSFLSIIYQVYVALNIDPRRLLMIITRNGSSQTTEDERYENNLPVENRSIAMFL